MTLLGSDQKRGILISLNDNDLDITVYRTMKLCRFIDLLKNKNNGLVSLKKWEDPFENFFLERTTVVTGEGEYGDLTALAASWYGQCWTTNEESDALWRIYSHDKTGVKISAKLGNLLKGVEGISDYPTLQAFAGRVSYMTKNDILNHMQGITFFDLASGGSNTPFAKMILIKREAFSHESEVRLLFNDVKKIAAENGVVNIPFSPNEMLNSVVVDPRLSIEEAEALMNNFRNLGLTVPISRSTLYEPPSFTIPLGP